MESYGQQWLQYGNGDKWWEYVKIQGLDWATVIQWLPSDAINAELKPVLEAYLQRCHQRDAYQRAILQRKAKL